MLNNKIYTKLICVAILIFSIIGMIKYYGFIDNNSYIETINIFENNSKRYVYPLGNIVGIKANTDGVLVIGYEEDDIMYIGGLKIGDNIVKINNKQINSSNDVSELLNTLKTDEVKIGFQRDNEYKEEIVKVKNENGKYKLGLWVRDKISGIGTMTLYDPSKETFFAIGHAITDVDTNKLLKIKEGFLYNANNLEIIKGNSENVGKIKGEFDLSKAIGKFDNNSNFGICGNLLDEINLLSGQIELGTSSDVKIGDAVILFEDENRNIRTYDIKIEKIIDDSTWDRDMVIKVTDEDLINYTGGIIQGMSGIPIIQNNKLIGSITHVFKKNPKKGYGIFIDEMVK